MVQLSFSSLFCGKNLEFVLESSATAKSNGEWNGELGFPGDHVINWTRFINYRAIPIFINKIANYRNVDNILLNLLNKLIPLR
jgi:hypothetical protein